VAVPGPTISFAFNLAKIPDQGEDSDPILRDGPDLGLVGVFDGMGGAGGTVYETPEGRRSGAYLASRLARDVVERRMLDLLEPDWNLPGRPTAEDLRSSVKQALVEKLAELNPPRSGLRSKLLRALPTTMALVALQRTQPGGPVWSCHVLWAGDSRAYVFEPGGVRQLSTDDIRDAGDAMANLREDSVVSNAMSADTDFHVNYRKVELQAPFLVLCATDGCFGFVPSPMHFEHLVLSHLVSQRSVSAWSQAVQADIAAVTGDDAAMAALGVGAEFRQFQVLFRDRVAELERDFTEPLDRAQQAVQRAERELDRSRRELRDTTAKLWSSYKASYERYLSDDTAEAEEDGAPRSGPPPAADADAGADAPAAATPTTDAAGAGPERDEEPPA
jgi:serine/threonine protein phosphatase PrpC